MDMKCVINVDNNVEWYGIEMLFYEDSNNKTQSKRLTHGLRYKIVEQNFQIYRVLRKQIKLKIRWIFFFNLLQAMC